MKNELSKKRYRTVGHAHEVERIKSYFPKKLFPSVGMGVLTSIISMMALSVLMALIIYRTADPASYVTPAAYTALYISALIAGLASSKLNKRSALLCGLLTGGLLLAICFIMGLILSGAHSSDYSVVEDLLLKCAVLVCSVIGAFIGSTQKTRKNKKRNTYKKR